LRVGFHGELERHAGVQGWLTDDLGKNRYAEETIQRTLKEIESGARRIYDSTGKQLRGEEAKRAYLNAMKETLGPEIKTGKRDIEFIPGKGTVEKDRMEKTADFLARLGLPATPEGKPDDKNAGKNLDTIAKNTGDMVSAVKGLNTGYAP
jgi:hypothetical protein